MSPKWNYWEKLWMGYNNRWKPPKNENKVKTPLNRPKLLKLFIPFFQKHGEFVYLNHALKIMNFFKYISFNEKVTGVKLPDNNIVYEKKHVSSTNGFRFIRRQRRLKKVFTTLTSSTFQLKLWKYYFVYKWQIFLWILPASRRNIYLVTTPKKHVPSFTRISILFSFLKKFFRAQLSVCFYKVFFF